MSFLKEGSKSFQNNEKRLLKMKKAILLIKIFKGSDIFNK